MHAVPMMTTQLIAKGRWQEHTLITSWICFIVSYESPSGRCRATLPRLLLTFCRAVQQAAALHCRVSFSMP